MVVRKDSSRIPKVNIVFRSSGNALGVKRRIGAVNRRLLRSRRMVNKTLESENDVGHLINFNQFRHK